MVGGAVYLPGGDTRAAFDDGAFRSNSAVGGWGGAIAVDADQPVGITLGACAFDGNRADLEGGAIAATSAESATITVTGGSFTSNSAGGTGGGVALSEGTILTSTGVDWGSGGTDNSPDDVTGYTFEADATFVCVEFVCK